MIYAWHHAAALAGSLALCAAVYRRPWTRVHPRAATMLWHLILSTVAISLIGLLLSLGLRGLGLGILPAVGAAGDVRLGAGDLLALLAATIVVAAGAGAHVTTILHRSRARERHRELLDLVGDASRPDVTVIDHHGIAVYTLPGRDARIVATTGALRQLSRDELRAVLAHEQGHLAGQHDIALFPFHALRRTLPRFRFAAALEDEVTLLLELCADAHAARQGYRTELLRALDSLTPEHSSAVGERRTRLEAPATGRRTLTAAALFTTALTLTATSLSLYALPA
jgi:Zn-dependent protease with chaperone function